MVIELRMPALSPTMEEGSLAKWLVKQGDTIKLGDVLAEIETDKATMELEATDAGVMREIVVAAGTEGVAVGTLIALLGAEGGSDAVSPVSADVPARAVEAVVPAFEDAPAPAYDDEIVVAPVASDDSPRAARPPRNGSGVSPLAARMAEALGINLSGLQGTGPGGRIALADLKLTPVAAPAPMPVPLPAPASVAMPVVPDSAPPEGVPVQTVKLSNIRRTIARRLTESKQQVPHIYLSLDIRLDALLGLRSDLNRELAARDIKLSVNDMIIRAHALALIQCVDANVQFAGTKLHRFARADIAVAVSIPGGLITPIIQAADTKSLSTIAREMKDLTARARDGKLQPAEYQGGTASLSNLGMFGIRQFEAVINPPQAMILAVGQGEERMIVVDGQPTVATILCATGSFDHRAIDGADAARFMQALKAIVEDPLILLA